MRMTKKKFDDFCWICGRTREELAKEKIKLTDEDYCGSYSVNLCKVCKDIIIVLSGDVAKEILSGFVFRISNGLRGLLGVAKR